MHLIQPLYEYLILSLNDRIHGTDIYKKLKEYRKLNNLTREEVKDLQFRKLKDLLLYAQAHSAYYKKVFIENGFSPQKMQSVEDIRVLPVLTREELLKHKDEIKSDQVSFSQLRKGSSSGSTGKPVVFYKDKNTISSGKAASYFGYEFGPWRFGMKGLHVWGNPETVHKQWSKPTSKIKATLYRQHKFPSIGLTTSESFFKLYDLCRKKRFDFIGGYTNAIYAFASFLEAENLSLTSLKCILTTGENLLPFQRITIEQNLAPIYDLYGCSEITGIASECRACGSYHIMDNHVLVEFGSTTTVEGDQQLILTDLDNYGFPMIRYSNGDMALEGKQNNCHIPLSSLARITGRMSDIIFMESGGILSVPSFFGSSLLKSIDGLEHYQVIRDVKDHLQINIVVNEKFSKDQHKKLASAVDNYLGNQIKWDIVIVESIPKSINGKNKLVIDLTR